MKWRVIPLEARDAYSNMAIDNAVMEAVKNRTSPPTIRFYKWLPGAVSIGNFQSMAGEVNIDECKRLSVSYVRRITGGGAVYHDNSGEITYSVVAPESLFPKNIIESYKEICSWVISGFAILGIKAEFAPINDILVKGRKISGNAQTRRDGVLLQHGTILYDADVRKMFSVLKVSKEKISDKLINSVEERITRVVDHASITHDELYNALLEGFVNGKEYEFGKFSAVELERAAALEKEIYSTDSWNFSR